MEASTAGFDDVERVWHAYQVASHAADANCFEHPLSKAPLRQRGVGELGMSGSVRSGLRNATRKNFVPLEISNAVEQEAIKHVQSLRQAQRRTANAWFGVNIAVGDAAPLVSDRGSGPYWRVASRVSKSVAAICSARDLTNSIFFLRRAGWPLHSSAGIPHYRTPRGIE